VPAVTMPTLTVPEWRALLVGGGLERIALGAAALSAPAHAARLCQIKAEEDSPATRYLLRLLGVRDIVLGAVTLASRRSPDFARKAIMVNLACQLGDCVALGQEVRKRKGIDAQTGLGLAFSVVGLAVWGGSLAQSPRPRRRPRLRRGRRAKVDILAEASAVGETARKKLRAVA
jgi:hypothetical protein